MSKELGDTLRKLRNRCKLTQRQVAEALYIDRATYTYWELGKTEPSLKSLGELAKLFNVSPAVFFTGVCGRAPKTNYDRIKAMSVEEMARMIISGKRGFNCNRCKGNKHKSCDNKCYEHCIEYLESEVW